jgi:hypothetical protein
MYHLHDNIIKLKLTKNLDTRVFNLERGRNGFDGDIEAQSSMPRFCLLVKQMENL